MRNKIIYIVFILCCFVLFSCNTDEPTSIKKDNQQENGSDANGTSNSNNNSSDDKYYFELDRPAAREIKTESGTTQIFFKCNQEYSIHFSGNITGMKLSHTSGTGSGSVTVSFDNVQYRESGSDITWNESGFVIFTAKEGLKANFKEVRKEFYLVRRGSKMKV